MPILAFYFKERPTMPYHRKAAHCLEVSHPDIWQQVRSAESGANPMLLGFWLFHLKQARRNGVAPERAAASFVRATSRHCLH